MAPAAWRLTNCICKAHQPQSVSLPLATIFPSLFFSNEPWVSSIGNLLAFTSLLICSTSDPSAILFSKSGAALRSMSIILPASSSIMSPVSMLEMIGGSCQVRFLMVSGSVLAMNSILLVACVCRWLLMMATRPLAFLRCTHRVHRIRTCTPKYHQHLPRYPHRAP